MRWTPETLASVAGGVVRKRSARPIATSFIDTRSPRLDGLFVPIVAARDGHEFIQDAIGGGASAVLIGRGRPVPGGDVTVVEVDDTYQAFVRLAQDARAHVTGPVVAITGSNGKTTTRALIAAVLSGAGRRVLATRGNFNNHLGVPLTVLDEPHDPDAMVVELGMSAPGENATLAAIVRPTIGVITSIALEHLEFLGSLEAIAAAEAETVDYLPDDGVLVVPDDEPLLRPHVPGRFRGRVLRFGSTARADVRVVAVTPGPRTFVELDVFGQTLRTHLRVFGSHNGRNAAAAVAVGHVLGADPEGMAAALETVEPVGDRGRVFSWGDHWVIADCYNANPGSVEVALRSLAQLRGVRAGPLVVVLGDMLELGPRSEELHAAVGSQAAELGVDAMVTVGLASRHAALAASRGGVDAVHVGDDLEQAVAKLRQHLCDREPGAVLVKGSRGLKLERVLERLSGS